MENNREGQNAYYGKISSTHGLDKTHYRPAEQVCQHFRQRFVFPRGPGYGKPLGQNGENKFLIFDFDFLPAEHLLLYS
jgi:hypothetical protein